MKIFRIILIVVGLLLMLDTAFVLTISSVNLGVIMPFIIGLPLLVLGLFLSPITNFFNSNIFGAIIKWGIIAAYGAFFTLFALTTTLLLVASAKAPKPGADALIVLGAGLRGDRISLTLKYRLDAAYEYLKENEATLCIVSGGMGKSETVTEASAMKAYLISRGIDAERIIEEEESKSTLENFIFSKKIIKKNFGCDAHTVFVTTNFHVFRASLVASRAGLETESLSALNVWYISLNDYMRECAALTEYIIAGKV